MTWLPKEAIAERYGLGEVRESDTLAGGMFVRPVRVETDRGSFVIRGAGFRNNIDALLYEVDVVNHAHDNGVRCPRVLSDRDGRLVCEHDGALWTVWTFLAGELYPWPKWWRVKLDEPERLASVAHDVAAMHETLAQAQPRGDAYLDPTLPVIQFDQLDVVRRTWRADMEALSRQGNVAATQSRDAFARQAARIDEHWQWLGDQVEASGVLDLPRQIVHGDVSPVNLVFEDGAPGFIDWDNVHVGWRYYDALGDVLVRPPWDRPEYHSVHFDLIRAYGRAYADRCRPGLTREEAACTAPFMLARQLEDLRQRLRVVPNLAAERDEEYATLIDVRVKLMDELRRRADDELSADRIA